MTRQLALGMALLAACGCRPAATPFDPAAAAARVGHRLYAENLIADPEVNAQASRYAVRVDQGTSPDAILSEFDHWLAEWMRRHPDRVSRAGMMPRPPGDH